MIIDGDAHISPTPEDGMSITGDDLLRAMDYAGVDKAIVWPHPPYLRTIDESNRYVHQVAQQHPDRVLPFGWADPRLGVDVAMESLRRCFDDYGFYGVKLNGSLNNYYIDDPALALPLIEDIASRGKVLAFHVGTDAYEKTHPFRVAKIAGQFPDLDILMVHMGGVGFFDLTNAAIEFAQQHPNLLLVGSAVRTQPILTAIQQLGPQRVSFGSDIPYEVLHVEVARYEAMLADTVTDAEHHDIMAGNILRLLNLEETAVQG